MRSPGTRFALALSTLILVAVPAHAQTTAPPPPAAAAPSGNFKNLKVLPQDISQAELRAMMREFALGLGVRCEYCHAITDQPDADHATEFSLDDKPTKLKAREMIRMVRDINQKYLAGLEHRAEPPIKVECVTCHHGAPQPRTLQSILRTAYDTGGLDSTVARYHTLRSRYYGRATYDFGDATLADVGAGLMQAGHGADAESLFAFNAAVNPASAPAKRQWNTVSVANGFRRGAADGASAVALVRSRDGEKAAGEEMINAIAYQLLGRQENAAALAAARFNVEEHPQSSGAYDTLGEVYLKSGDSRRAQESYRKALALDPRNDNAKKQLEAIRNPPKKVKP